MSRITSAASGSPRSSMEISRDKARCSPASSLWANVSDKGAALTLTLPQREWIIQLYHWPGNMDSRYRGNDDYVVKEKQGRGDSVAELTAESAGPGR